MDGYKNFLIAAAPYIIGFFVVVLILIIILKIALYFREKKLSSKPQEFNRFDLDDFNDNTSEKINDDT